jgi:hypothetical protein
VIRRFKRWLYLRRRYAYQMRDLNLLPSAFESNHTRRRRLLAALKFPDGRLVTREGLRHLVAEVLEIKPLQVRIDSHTHEARIVAYVPRGTGPRAVARAEQAVRESVPVGFSFVIVREDTAC